MSILDRRILTAIHQLIIEHGYSPSFQEIMERSGARSKQTVQAAFSRLRDLGLITFRARHARTVRVTADGEFEVEL